MKRKSCIITVLVLTCVLALSGCNAGSEIPYGESLNAARAGEILSEQKDEVIGADDAFKIRSVAQSDTSSAVANQKFELDIDAATVGNVYDPAEVDIYGEFVSPSKEVYKMPAFYYLDYDRKLDVLDESIDYPMPGYVQQDADLAGRIDTVNGVKKPVGKITFHSLENQHANAGAIIDAGGVTKLQDTVSVWLKKDAGLAAEKLYLRFYQSAGEAYIRLPELTEEWHKYTFAYSDFTFLKAGSVSGTAAELPMSSMYSFAVQNRGSAANGDVYISNLSFYRAGLESDYAALSSFVAPALKHYKNGELNGTEIVERTEAAPIFKLRFRFDEEGEWTYRVSALQNGALKSKFTSSVTVTAETQADHKGLIRVEPTQKRNFIFEDGTPYVAFGHNLAYSVDPTRGSYDYEVYMPKMAEAGMNFMRVWLTYIGYGAQSTGGGILNYDDRQDRSYQMDHIVELAEQNGIYLQIPLMTFSRFHEEGPEDDVEWRSWDSSPYNVINGGYLAKPEEFWTDARAKEDTKKLYRYYIARYSYSSNILNWEIMNEIGESSNYNERDAKAWADEIGAFMHGTDPYRHLVSLSSKTFKEEVYSSKELDFVSIHSYVWGSSYASSAASVTKQVYEEYGKPVMIGEIGASGNSEEENIMFDKDGMVITQTAWTAPMSGAAGGGMLWWWQQINAHGFYDNVTPAQKYFGLLPDTFVAMGSLQAADYEFAPQDGVTNPMFGANYVSALGFKSNSAVYAYVYDTRYSFANTNPPVFSGTGATGRASRITFEGMKDGGYTVFFVDTATGDIVPAKTMELTAVGGKLELNLDAWSRDFALMIDAK